MSIMNQTENVNHQYSDDKNLSIRISLHAKYSTNKKGFWTWLFEHYCFAKNDSILELGCGNGSQWEYGILPHGCKLILSDFSDGMVDTVKGKFSSHSNITFQKIDIQEIPYKDESFDVIIANHMLYHVPDFDKALSEVRRVLKPSGHFFATTNGSGGMSLFLHKAFRLLDEKSEAFSQRYSFNLQNGSELLSRYFPSVERLDYEDSLAVTETQDLMDWIKSTISISGYSEESINELHEYFESIRVKDGAIIIPKETGLFICEKQPALPI